ncbi:MAG TPA: hypothetical protein VGM67_16445 [Gemmatimonadaceae bacterium]|jgi:hypothetical protein
MASHLAFRYVCLACVTLATLSCSASTVEPPAGTCKSPAPIRNSPDPNLPSIYVGFKTGVDGPAAIGRLTDELGFTVEWIPTGSSGFLTTLTDQQIAVVRCDAAVDFVEWSVVGTPGSSDERPTAR